MWWLTISCRSGLEFLWHIPGAQNETGEDENIGHNTEVAEKYSVEPGLEGVDFLIIQRKLVRQEAKLKLEADVGD